MLARFDKRQRIPELMDDPALDEAAHRRALRGLDRINVISRTVATLWPPIARVAAARGVARTSLLDVACGGGAVAVALARRANRRGVALDVSGCDISETALGYARTRAAAEGVTVRCFRLDALTDPVPERYDIAVTTLFLHHLADTEIVVLLKRLADCADHVFVSDLLRGASGYALAWIGTQALSRSRIVHVDGLRSVRAALSMPEAQRLVAEAGLRDAHFQHSWPRRFLMCWTRPAAAGAAGRAHDA